MSSLGGGITGVNLMATGGASTPYPNIGAALAAASSGDAVVVGPGTYAESITIPDGVRLVGFPAGFAVQITGADTTSTRVTMGVGCTLRDFTVVGPSSGANPAITTNNATGNNILFTVTCTGAGGTGPFLQKNGTGGLAVALMGYNGGTIGGAILDLSSGTTRFVQGGANANFGTAGQFLKTSGTATVLGNLFQVGPAMVLTDALQVGGTSTVVLSSMVIPDINTTTTNGLHIVSDGVSIKLNNFELKGSSFDFLADGGLTGVGSSLTLNACTLRFEKLSAPAGYLMGLDLAIVTYMDRGIENDPAFRVGGELSVGVPARPAESAFGEGDSTVNGLLVFTTNSSGTGFVDESADAKSSSGSTFNFFRGLASGHICYIGSQNPTRPFYGVKLDIPATAMNLGGSGAVVWEYWNGASWVSMRIFATGAPFPHTSRAQQALQNTGGEHVRFDYDTMQANWATTTVNGQTAYWIRVRITTVINTFPVVERIKLHTNRTEINESGSVTFFGAAQPSLALMVHYNLTDDVSGSSPGNQTITFASGISLTIVDNDYVNSTTDEVGWVRRVAKRQDTSRAITFRAVYAPSNTNTGNVVFRLVYALLPVGTTWNGSAPSTTLSQTVAQSGVTDRSAVVEFTFAVPDALPGDIIAFKFGRLGSSGADTFTGNIEVGLIEANGTAWSV